MIKTDRKSNFDTYNSWNINVNTILNLENSYVKVYFFASWDDQYSSVSDPDPYPLAGSGSASGNVDLDPVPKQNRDKLAYKSTKIIKNIIVLFNIRE